MPITRASRHKSPITIAFLICTLILFSPLSFVQGSRSSPYDSGYDHGCDDAGISDPSERYINQDEKGPDYHTGEFMSGYYAGVNACSGSSDKSEQQPESDDSNPTLNDDIDTMPPTNNAINWLEICNNPVVDAIVTEPCEDLTSSDGYELTQEGQKVLVCFAGGTVAVLFPKAVPILLMQGNLVGCQNGFLNNVIRG